MKPVALLIAFVLQFNSYALSCLEPKLETYVQNAFILKAKVIDVVEEGKKGEYQVEITEYIKGKSDVKESKLHVFTWVGHPKFTEGEEYIFFTDKAQEIHTGACGLHYKSNNSEALLKIKNLLNLQANGQAGSL